MTETSRTVHFRFRFEYGKRRMEVFSILKLFNKFTSKIPTASKKNRQKNTDRVYIVIAMYISPSNPPATLLFHFLADGGGVSIGGTTRYYRNF